MSGGKAEKRGGPQVQGAGQSMAMTCEVPLLSSSLHSIPQQGVLGSQRQAQPRLPAATELKLHLGL